MSLVTWIGDRMPVGTETLEDGSVVDAEYDRRPMDGVIGFAVHHSNGPGGTDEVAAHHVNVKGWPGVGYPLMVRHGRVYQAAHLDRATYHAGRHNDARIGICFLGSYDLRVPPQEDLEAGAHVLALLAERLELQRAGDVVGPLWGRAAVVAPHRALRFASRKARWGGMPAKTCPGMSFPLASLAFLVEEFRQRPQYTIESSGLVLPESIVSAG